MPILSGKKLMEEVVMIDQKRLHTLRKGIWWQEKAKAIHLEIKKKKLPHKEDIFKQFLKLVETHHYKERDISFYAEKLCLTPKYLSSIIRDVSGELAGNWIDNYVIIEAKALLISSNLTIQEICYKLNFSTPSSFTRFFKRITGMSPRKFRTLKVFPNLIE